MRTQAATTSTRPCSATAQHGRATPFHSESTTLAAANSTLHAVQRADHRSMPSRTSCCTSTRSTRCCTPTRDTPAARHPVGPGSVARSRLEQADSSLTAQRPPLSRRAQGDHPLLTGHQPGPCSSAPGRVTSSVTAGCHARRVNALTCVETGITVFRWYERDSVTVGPNTILDAEAPCRVREGTVTGDDLRCRPPEVSEAVA